MKVYITETIGYDPNIIGVFSTRDNARRALGKANGIVTEIEVDSIHEQGIGGCSHVLHRGLSSLEEDN